jgi:diaminohydroxyphosphoribosylaminopyrimidine deaminase/5-amino-6-(5-phosphoribosylamino)uracil reductase
MDQAGDSEWMALLAGSAAGGSLGALFGPILATPAAEDGCMLVGRLAQTLDGRIATRGGVSQWIGGAGDLRHTHRLRALCDAVVVGGGTVAADDPLLTTRLVPGPNPLRVVLDTEARLPVGHKLFQSGPATLLVVAQDRALGHPPGHPPGHAPGPPPGRLHGLAEVLALPRGADGRLDLAALVGALAGRGCRKIFIEGGGVTVSRFLMAGLLDRLHVTIAPIILGSGRPAFALPEAQSIADGLRFGWTMHDIAPDLLCDIALNRARPPLCR